MVRKRLIALFGILLFAFILSRADLGRVSSTMLSADPALLAIALCISLVLILFKGLKWKYVLSAQGQRISIMRAAKYFTIGFFFSSFTPARAGDFVRALYIRAQAGLPLALSSVVLDRVIDVSVLAAFAVLSSWGFAALYGAPLVPQEALAALVLGLVLGVFLLLREKYAKAVLRPVYSMIIPDEMKPALSAGFSGFFSSVKLVSRNMKDFGIAVFSGVAFWVLAVLFSYVLALSLHIELPLHFFFLLYSIVSLSDLLPLTVSGLGTRDAVVILLFSFLGIGTEQAIAYSLTMFATTYLLVAAIGYAMFSAEPIDLKSVFAGSKGGKS